MSKNMSSRSKIKMIKREVEAIFKQSKTNDAVYTHVSMGGTVYAGKFNFTEVQFKNLIKLISKGIKYNFYLPIAEISREYGPIKVDLDLKIPEFAFLSDSGLPGERAEIWEAVNFSSSVNFFATNM